MTRILKDVAAKQITKEDLAKRVVAKPQLIGQLFEGLTAPDAATKYGSEKILRILSKTNPELLLPYFDEFVENLGHEVKILRLGALNVIANLACVTSQAQIESVFDRYFRPIGQKEMIPASNAVAGGALIANSFPELADDVAKVLLSVQKKSYETDECKEVAVGKSLESLHKIYPLCEQKNQRAIVRLARKYLASPRSGTVKKAEKLLKKYG